MAPFWHPSQTTGTLIPETAMAENMTAHWIDRLKPPAEGRAEYFDAKVPGLLLRVTATGKKSWYLMYRVKGDLKRRRHPLGAMPPVGLADARDKAREFLLALSKGDDPTEIRAEEKRLDERDGPYFKNLAEDYIEKYAKLRKRTWEEDEARLKNILLPAFGSKKAKMIKRREVIDLITGIHDRGAPIQANRTLALLRKIFNWAIERDILETSPCFKVKAPGKETSRERVLTGIEIKKVWAAIEGLAHADEDLKKGSASMGAFMATMFKIRFLTAQRGGEVETMRWADVDLDAGWWTIPAEKAKNGLSHRVPLTPAVVVLLKEQKSRCKDSPWVFPSRTVKDKPISNIQKAAQRVQEASGVEFVMHDLRRTAASFMASLGVQRLVISKVLNHVEPGVTRVYDRHGYDKEKRDALSAWAEALERILADSKK